MAVLAPLAILLLVSSAALTREALMLVEAAGADGVTCADLARGLWADRRTWRDARRVRLNSAAGALLARLRAAGLVATVGSGRRARHVLSGAGAAFLEQCRAELREAHLA